MSGASEVDRSGAATHRVTVHGHERVVSALMRSVRAGRTAQACLLAGPPGVGKRTVARALAQALLCASPAPDATACGRCRACRLVREGGYADLHLLEPPLRVDAVRDLQRLLVLSPAEGARRVAIVPEVDAASPAAANSLLKTLEEPPAHAVLLLTTSAPSVVLPTVRSRCRLLTLRALSVATVSGALTAAWGVPPERAALVAALSGGRLGWAVRAIEAEGALDARAGWLDILAVVRGADRAGRMARAASVAELGDELPLCLSAWRTWWRDLLLCQHDLVAAVTNGDRLAEIRSAAAMCGVRDALRALRLLDEVLVRLAANANPRLAVEVLVLGMP